MIWTEARIAVLTRMWGEKATASQIGRVIGATRNAVIGKASRLGLEGRPSPIIRDESAPRNRRVKRRLDTKLYRESDRRAEAPKTATVALSPRLVPVKDCRWTDSDRAPWVFCDAPAVPGRPYCEAHCQRAYNGYGKGATSPTVDPVQHQYGNAAKFR